ncbi:hypothetical protein UFOVP558_53 [uncultured Caudovirales phage]|uniref:Uncharacterized protein n=1 Tax=uncultured Caudovirales phage TaxID=2100421 RepID=A0A6J5MT47_9CAUD|nr:hypothetical protein UFOVP558_53 [uncultured Caudovirales phage]
MSPSRLNVKNFIEVRFQFEGIHHWPEAPREVDFLRDKHRHIFHVRARMNVSHDDRELEFILVQHKLKALVSCFGYDLGRLSCEQIAYEILKYCVQDLGRSEIEVEVSEDGENGAVVRYG